MVASVPMDAPAITSEKLRNFPASEKRTVEILAEALTNEISDSEGGFAFDDIERGFRADRLKSILKDFLDLCDELNRVMDSHSSDRITELEDELQGAEGELRTAHEKIADFKEEIRRLKLAAK